MSIVKPKLKRLLRMCRWFMAYFPQRNNKHFSRVILSDTKAVSNQLELSGTLYANHNLENANLVIRKFREEEVAAFVSIDIAPARLLERILLTLLWPLTKVRAYKFTVITDFNWSQLPSSTYILSMDMDGSSARFFYKQRMSATYHFPDGSHTIHLFEEPVLSSLRLELFKFGADEFQKIASYSNGEKTDIFKVCLIYEYSNSARDNGIVFYDYLNSINSNIKPIYIIEKNNADSLEVDGKTIVEYGSIEHFKACIDADILAFTHHRTYCYPHILRDLNQRRYENIFTIFLQHGVTALKKTVQKPYIKEICNYSSVVVCSDKERNIFAEYMNFPLDDIYVTGFPRYDRLYELNAENKTTKSILVFPTWRKGLERQDSEVVKCSTYYKEWTSALIKIREKFDGEIIFIIHPILQRHVHLFADYVDRISYATNFQKELVTSLCLITDYSSVCFDALYLKKPVVMFQFDREEYGFNRDAFINIDTELPGVFAATATDVQNEIIKLNRSNWLSCNNALRDLYFKWDDNKNSERLAGMIDELR